ncbi:FOG: HEAT repeat [hydrothermal vent metagenome]|uniref:FOG: HEAT repeat n=1 Tax=hydrothermal vent metagenome TaxID=652676 RepID=A0A3B1CWR8_9ZZZZ
MGGKVLREVSKKTKNKEIESRRQKILSMKNRPEGLNYILDSFKDESWRIRKTALNVLIEGFSPDSYIKDLIGLLYIEDNAGARNTAIEALISLGKKAVPQLIEAFESGNHDVRKFIIDILGFIGGQEVLPLLLRAIKDEDVNVRASAVECLGRLKETSVIGSLVEIIETGEVWTAYPAVDALGLMGDRTAIPYLLKVLKNSLLTEPALKALSKFSEPETLKEIIPFLLDQRRSVVEEALRTIEKFYQDGTSEEFISEQLHNILGDDAFNILLRHINHTNRDVKGPAIVLLGLLCDHRAIKPLLELSEDEFFRDAVKRSLVFIGKKDPDYLIPIVKTEIPERNRLIVEVISELQNPAFYVILSRLLMDHDGHVVAHAARGLGRIGDRRAAEEIFPLLIHPYPDVQEAAVAALTELKNFLSITELIDKLSSPKVLSRKNTALILGNIHAGKSIEALGFAVKDESEEVRKAAVKAISMIGGEHAKRYLRTALTDESAEIRAIATENLSFLPGGMDALDSLDSIIVMTKDPDEGVRASAARALSVYKDELSLKTLIGLLKDSNGFVVTQAIESISLFSDRKEARESLIKLLLSDDSEIRRTAILSMSSFPDVEEEVEPHLFSEDWATRYAAVQVLSKTGTQQSRVCLEGIYDIEDDPTVRKAIEVALGV